VNRKQVCRILDGHGIRYAVIGAIAIAARGAPRSTFDFDLLTTDKRVLQASFWNELTASGVDVDVRRGDVDDPLAGVVRIGRGIDLIDVVVGRWKWQEAIIDRAEFVEIEGIDVRLPLTSDLILLKLAAGGPLDQQDVIRLLDTGSRSHLVHEVEEHISDLDADARALWNQIQSHDFH
jgi:predicted nucleotidyltransferase